MDMNILGENQGVKFLPHHAVWFYRIMDKFRDEKSK